jgi:ubiquinone/menaquinone biosynthesis C-methylase UbiE
METKISVLLVNLNNLSYTKQCLEDLLNQDIVFDLRLVDQNSSETGTKEFFDSFFTKHLNGDFYGKINYLEFSNTGFNKPLNHLWNDYVKESSTEFICLLNNDVRISPNFLSSSISVLEKEPSVGFVNHVTNNLTYSSWSDSLEYVIMETPYRQGWDPTFRKSFYNQIPENLNFFYGDDFIYSKLYESGYKGAYILNSPMIHFERSTTIEKGGQRDCSDDGGVFHTLNLEYKNLTFNESLCKWKPEFNIITKKEISYDKESYITRDPNVDIWREHLNTNILNDYSSILTGVVADFGCNHGACTIIASENKSIKEIIGIDINKESLGIANDLTIQHGVKNIKYLHSNLTDLLEIPSSYFDNAFSFHTLEHIHINDYDLVFSEWKRVIKNEGHFIISVPYEHAYDDPCHMNYFNESSISNLFVKYGFDIVEVYRDTRNNFDCLNLVCKNIKQEQQLLSILVCSLVERNNTFLSDLISSIEKQIIGKPVELLILSDNAKRPVGTKRNDLLNISKGRYVCFIDDDDRISETYVDDILQEIIDWSPDVIVFDAEITFNGINPKLVKYGREYDYCEKLDAYYRHPNHLMVHKKENITEYFRDVKTGEDDEWASRMLPRIITQSRINKVLYYYDYNTSTKKYFE